MNPTSTISAAVVATPVISQLTTTVADPTAIAQLWMGRLDLFASVFGFFCTVLLGVLALLTWGNIKQKEEAAKQLASIKKMGQNISSLHKQFNGIMGESKKLLDTATTQIQNASGLLKEAEATLESAKAKGAVVGDLQAKMERLSTQMAGTIPAISGAGASLPFISGIPDYNGDVFTEAFHDYMGGANAGAIPVYYSHQTPTHTHVRPAPNYGSVPLVVTTSTPSSGPAVAQPRVSTPTSTTTSSRGSKSGRSSKP